MEVLFNKDYQSQRDIENVDEAYHDDEEERVASPVNKATST